MKLAPTPLSPWLRIGRGLSLGSLLSVLSLVLSACIGRPDWGTMCGDEGKVKDADDGCNTCICRDRAWICSNKQCSPEAETCSAGETKQVSCNTCTCDDGEWLCTRLACEDECSPDETKLAEDGCNTCGCAGGRWACTNKECTPSCQEGDTKAANDGCNACLCSEGEWICSEKACGPVCTEGDSKSAGDECNTCSCQGGAWVCTRDWCGPRCSDGELKTAADNCNTCICHEGNWSCTLRTCSCSEGQTIDAGDGCNTCTCGKNGWRCTERTCGELRNCTEASNDSECGDLHYCVFSTSSKCSSSKGEFGACIPRPLRCGGDVEQVCGCDQVTYSSACHAALAGVGVFHSGSCEGG